LLLYEENEIYFTSTKAMKMELREVGRSRLHRVRMLLDEVREIKSPTA
jgi:hypothetical protein